MDSITSAMGTKSRGAPGERPSSAVLVFGPGRCVGLAEQHVELGQRGGDHAQVNGLRRFPVADEGLVQRAEDFGKHLLPCGLRLSMFDYVTHVRRLFATLNYSAYRSLVHGRNGANVPQYISGSPFSLLRRRSEGSIGDGGCCLKELMVCLTHCFDHSGTRSSA